MRELIERVGRLGKGERPCRWDIRAKVDARHDTCKGWSEVQAPDFDVAEPVPCEKGLKHFTARRAGGRVDIRRLSRAEVAEIERAVLQ